MDVITPGEIKINKCYKPVKRLLDIIFGLLMLVVLSPIFILIAIIVKLDSRGPAIYSQERIGPYGRLFILYKFRTMKVGTPVLSTEDMQKQAYDPYTSFGKLLRKTSLDELPQLMNIIKGEMSFIGPRPALPSQNDVNALREKMGVHQVKPGITGMAQVMGRDDLDDETKVRYDSDYCRNMSLLFDAKLLVLTFSAILSARGNK